MLREPAGEGPGIVAWEGAGQHAGAARVGEDGRDLDVALARLIDHREPDAGARRIRDRRT